MAGRRPKAVEDIKGNRSVDELTARKQSQPTTGEAIGAVDYSVPPSLEGDEIAKWNEMIALFKRMRNCTYDDVDKDTLINYCKSWVRFIKADRHYQANPTDKDNYKVLMDNAKLLAKLKSDLMLDPFSRIKAGNLLFQNGHRPDKDKVDDFLEG